MHIYRKKNNFYFQKKFITDLIAWNSPIISERKHVLVHKENVNILHVLTVSWFYLYSQAIIYPGIYVVLSCLEGVSKFKKALKRLVERRILFKKEHMNLTPFARRNDAMYALLLLRLFRNITPFWFFSYGFSFVTQRKLIFLTS